MTDPFEIAVEHVAYCIAQGMTARDILAAPTWNDAIWVLARIASDGQWHLVDVDKPVIIRRPLRLAA